MLIHVAENGHSFELDCQPTTVVEIVQNCLVSLTGIPVQEQMLICGDVRLEPQRSLGSYKLPSEGQHVFLFNRSRLVADCPPPLPEDPESVVASVVVPAVPSSVHGGRSHQHHPLDEADDPALKALPSYERQFKYHFQKGHAIFTASQIRFDTCRQLLREQQVQEMAVETAHGNMEFYYKIIDHAFTDFLRHFGRQHKQHSDLLLNFERDLERLKACKLHPSLWSENRKSLLDCVKEASLRKWAEECTFSHKQFGAKVAELKILYVDLQRNVQNLVYSPPVVNVRELENTIEDHVRFTEEEASIIQSLSKDVNTVKKLVDDCVSSQQLASLRPHDAVSALGPMYDVHDKSHLPRIEACDHELQNLLKYCKKSKNKMNLYVHTSLQNVAALQSNIRDMRNQLALFKEAMARQDEIFQELKKVRRVGPSYKACLAEVVRRRECMKLYMGQAGLLAEKLARKREIEVGHREEFLRIQSMYMPRDVLQAMGLFELPSQCVVNIAPFDTHLLDIDISDLERYAPESLVGRLPKLALGADANMRGGNSRSLSDSGFQSGGGSEGSRDAGDGDKLEGNEEIEGDEIAGTSKLEVENAWLKSEFASAVAMLWNLDLDFELEEGGGDSQDPENAGEVQRLAKAHSAALKTADALRLKDEHAKHLHTMLAMWQAKCGSYEKRIRELEQRLAEQHMQLQKTSLRNNHHQQNSHHQSHDLIGGNDDDAEEKEEESSSETSGVTGLGMGRIQSGLATPEPMDEGVTTSNAHAGSSMGGVEEGRTDSISGQRATAREGGDETMSDISGGVSITDAGMVESRKEETAGGGEGDKGFGHSTKEGGNVEIPIEEEQGADVKVRVDAVGITVRPTQGYVSGKDVEQTDAFLGEGKDGEVSTLQMLLKEKDSLLAAADERLKSMLAEVDRLHSELDGNTDLLSECQMNCAHLENRLHDAREEARINLCASDRRAAEYNALRASSVRLRGLMERLRSCIAAPVGNPSSFVDSLRSLAVSLSSASTSDGGEDTEFRTAVRILADRVANLVQQRAELLERCSAAEANQAHLNKELEKQTEILKTLYSKRNSDKQASKEKICFTRFDVHGLAVFLPNANGYYEAMNHNCPHYYLSTESIALFQEQGLPIGRTLYIVGQIVHIDRKVATLAPPTPSTPLSSSSSVSSTSDANLNGSEHISTTKMGMAAVQLHTRPNLNPYGLPLGTEFFVVTVAMVPDFSPHFT